MHRYVAKASRGGWGNEQTSEEWALLTWRVTTNTTMTTMPSPSPPSRNDTRTTRNVRTVLFFTPPFTLFYFRSGGAQESVNTLILSRKLHRCHESMENWKLWLHDDREALQKWPEMNDASMRFTFIWGGPVLANRWGSVPAAMLHIRVNISSPLFSFPVTPFPSQSSLWSAFLKTGQGLVRFCCIGICLRARCVWLQHFCFFWSAMQCWQNESKSDLSLIALLAKEPEMLGLNSLWNF